jgi:two-component system phosphate regulon sensor histidine kinase PhoR
MQQALTQDAPERNTHFAPQLTNARRLAIVFIALVVVPILLLLTIGVLILVVGNGRRDYILGSTVLSLVAMALAGIAATSSSVLRQVTLSRLQADWVSRLGHDLRTPLSSIRLFVETLQLGKVAEPSVRQHCLEILSRECARLSARVDQILSWARLDAGQRVYCKENCRAAEIIDEALGAFELQRIVEQAYVTREIPNEQLTVLVDRSATVEVLLNLLQNACRHTGEDKRITIGCDEGPDPGSVVLFVNDNGPGIAKQEHRWIFEKFYRTKDTLRRRLSGTGLGLAITRQIVRDHGGTVCVESELGCGSSFRVVLPAAVRE